MVDVVSIGMERLSEAQWNGFEAFLIRQENERELIQAKVYGSRGLLHPFRKFADPLAERYYQQFASRKILAGMKDSSWYISVACLLLACRDVGTLIFHAGSDENANNFQDMSLQVVLMSLRVIAAIVVVLPNSWLARFAETGDGSRLFSEFRTGQRATGYCKGPDESRGGHASSSSETDPTKTKGGSGDGAKGKENNTEVSEEEVGGAEREKNKWVDAPGKAESLQLKIASGVVGHLYAKRLVLSTVWIFLCLHSGLQALLQTRKGVMMGLADITYAFSILTLYLPDPQKAVEITAGGLSLVILPSIFFLGLDGLEVTIRIAVVMLALCWNAEEKNESLRLDFLGYIRDWAREGLYEESKAELRKTGRKLKRAIGAQKLLFTKITHDLKTPLNAVSHTINFLQEDLESDFAKMHAFLCWILSATDSWGGPASGGCPQGGSGNRLLRGGRRFRPAGTKGRETNKESLSLFEQLREQRGISCPSDQTDRRLSSPRTNLRRAAKKEKEEKELIESVSADVSDSEMRAQTILSENEGQKGEVNTETSEGAPSACLSSPSSSLLFHSERWHPQIYGRSLPQLRMHCGTLERLPPSQRGWPVEPAAAEKEEKEGETPLGAAAGGIGGASSRSNHLHGLVCHSPSSERSEALPLTVDDQRPFSSASAAMLPDDVLDSPTSQRGARGEKWELSTLILPQLQMLKKAHEKELNELDTLRAASHLMSTLVTCLLRVAREDAAVDGGEKGMKPNCEAATPFSCLRRALQMNLSAARVKGLKLLVKNHSALLLLNNQWGTPSEKGSLNYPSSPSVSSKGAVHGASGTQKENFIICEEDAVPMEASLLTNTSVSVPSMELLWLHMDEMRFVDCLNNALSNAIKYTDSGTVTVDVQVENLSVEDLKATCTCTNLKAKGGMTTEGEGASRLHADEAGQRHREQEEGSEGKAVSPLSLPVSQNNEETDEFVFGRYHGDTCPLATLQHPAGPTAGKREASACNETLGEAKAEPASAEGPMSPIPGAQGTEEQNDTTTPLSRSPNAAGEELRPDLSRTARPHSGSSPLTDPTVSTSLSPLPSSIGNSFSPTGRRTGVFQDYSSSPQTPSAGAEIKRSTISSDGLLETQVVRVTARVVDTGRGVPRTKLKALFKEFTQVDAKDSKVGTGLGLVITKRMAETMGGNCEIQSEGVGKGTTMALSFLAVRVLPPIEKVVSTKIAMTNQNSVNLQSPTHQTKSDSHKQHRAGKRGETGRKTRPVEVSDKRWAKGKGFMERLTQLTERPALQGFGHNKRSAASSSPSSVLRRLGGSEGEAGLCMSPNSMPSLSSLVGLFEKELNGTVVILDDDVFTRMTMQMLFKRLGISPSRTCSFCSADEAFLAIAGQLGVKIQYLGENRGGSSSSNGSCISGRSGGGVGECASGRNRSSRFELSDGSTRLFWTRPSNRFRGAMEGGGEKRVDATVITEVGQ
uniref:histidine kinase n=1 Tax=Chromera velia CCMP2878 TaxID=1169474 RepID=A0A0G4G772_9ALVE|eukprot:Cvel_4284.t1-p1 / transcript=Cvel_4284.t1 / gene=Cvel_4284 / organism=Chromera_velia_CCMP2878 / gene_product=hypothetical protein / transcript_product=hypothetical protein / location=Cvel_scaffold185:105546-118128(+) / protein_length=1449 / sequence_SO=supercontig / SO=protein_coding / is_pseudo=false